MEGIMQILQEFPWLILVLIGIFSSLFKGKKQEQQQQQKRQQQRQQQQRQKAASQASAQRQEDYEDYRRESAPSYSKREENPSFDWDVEVFGEGRREELEQKIREKVNPYLEQIEKKREQLTPIKERVSNEVKELSIMGQDISNDNPISMGELNLSEGTVVNSRHRIKPNRVVEGVMWSEILGKPRSRNPHRPVYAEHFSKRK